MNDSIHLKTLLNLNNLPLNLDLSAKMDGIRKICNAALFLRKDANIRVRMPLSELTVYSKNPLDMQDFVDIIKNEINVKNVFFSTDFANVANEKLIINLKKCGSIFGKQIPELVKAVNSGNWQKTDNGIVVLGQPLSSDLYEIKLDIKDANARVCSGEEMIVILDTQITLELENEGIARDIIRMIQQNRKDLQLNVADRIKIAIFCENEKIKFIIKDPKLSQYIANETLSTEISDNIAGNIFDHETEDFGVIKISIIK